MIDGCPQHRQSPVPRPSRADVVRISLVCHQAYGERWGIITNIAKSDLTHKNSSSASAFVRGWCQ